MSADATLRATSILRRLTVNAASLAAGGVIAQVCFIAVEALVARRLGSASYGVLSTAQALALTSLHFFELGMSWKIIQDGSREPSAIAPLLGTTFVLKVIFAAIVYAATLFILPLAGYDAAVVSFFAVFYGYAVLLALQDSLAGANAARQQMHINALYQAATPVAVLGLVALMTTGVPSLAAVGWAYVLGSLLVTSIWTWQTFRTEKPQVELSRTPEILRGSFLYGLGGLLFQISFRIEVFALSLLRGMAEVGLFAAAEKLTDIGVKVALLGSRVAAPVLFKQSRHDVAAYRRSCKIVIRGASVLGAAMGIVLAAAAEPLMVGLFGAAFRESAVILAFLAPSVALRFATAGVRLALTSSDQHLRRVGGLAGGVAVAAACNMALVPGFGAKGAAWARFLGEVAQIIVLLARHALPLPRGPLLWWMGGPLLLGAMAYGAARVVTQYAWAQLALALFVYAVVLTATGCVRPAEIRELIKVFRQSRQA